MPRCSYGLARRPITSSSFCFLGTTAEGALRGLAPLTPACGCPRSVADALPEGSMLSRSRAGSGRRAHARHDSKNGVSLPTLRAGTASGFDRFGAGARAAIGLPIACCGRRPALLALAPDLLGFRGALCRGGRRGNRSIRCGSPASGPRSRREAPLPAKQLARSRPARFVLGIGGESASRSPRSWPSPKLWQASPRAAPEEASVPTAVHPRSRARYRDRGASL